MKFTKKLWKKLYNERIYFWQLKRVIDGKDYIIYREVNKHIAEAHLGEKEERIEIPENKGVLSIQINQALRNISKGYERFLKARELSNNKSYLKLEVYFRIKELRKL